MILTLIAFIIVIGVIVFVHEFGHFIAAKLVGIRVERFSLGFPPKVVSKRIGDTEYCISWIPLGGYVKMAGMVDESLDGTGITGAPWEFESKNTWQKAFVLFSGVLMNFLLAVFLYGFITLVVGIGEIRTTEVNRVREGFPAAQAGIQPGDVILAVDGSTVQKWEQMSKIIHNKPEETVVVRWQRDGVIFEVPIQTRTELVLDRTKMKPIGLIGIEPVIHYRRAGLFEALGRGTLTTAGIVGLGVVSVKMLITGEASLKDLVGPIGIARLSGESVRMGILPFLGFIAFISVSIGFLNILPLPVLDGGHLLTIFIEGIRGRRISTKVKMAVQQVGLLLLLILMGVIVYNDILRWLGK